TNTTLDRGLTAERVRRENAEQARDAATEQITALNTTLSSTESKLAQAVAEQQAATRAHGMTEAALGQLREQHDVLIGEHTQSERRIATLEAELAAARQQALASDANAERRIADLRQMYEARAAEQPTGEEEGPRP
ncbi:hypothetical protein, partial [Actinoplanes sp. NPDC051851]|uniref:hypothetical protein n=1 Tax=Actinoplanes sp. NPDC051851 TaxID=3154753 RepID=UPI00341D55C5